MEVSLSLIGQEVKTILPKNLFALGYETDNNKNKMCWCLHPLATFENFLVPTISVKA